MSTPPRRAAPRRAAAVLLFWSASLAGPEVAHAQTVWNANLTVAAKAGVESKGATVSWSVAGLGACGTASHLELRYAKGSTPPDPGDPTAGTHVATLSTSATSFDHLVLHANTAYSYTIYACTSAGCATACSSVTKTAGTGATEPERWLLTGIRGHDLDTDHRVVPEADWEPGTPAPVRYYDGTYDGQIGVYFFSPNTAVPGPGIYLVRNQCTGWEDDWNDASTWSTACSAGWTTPEPLVTKTDGTGEHQSVGNPWVVRMVSDLIALFWVETESSGDRRINWMASVDADGDDWGTFCGDTGDCSSTTGCAIIDPLDPQAYCDLDDTGLDWETVLDATGNCLNATTGGHGRCMRNELPGGWDPASEDLVCLVTGRPNTSDPDAGCSTCTDSGQDDLNLVTWDASAGAWVLSTDATYGTCPVESLEDRHDPAVTAYPGGEFKVYAKDQHKNWWVAYTTDGVSFEDASRVRFYFDDGTLDLGTRLHGGCVEDLATLLWQETAQKEEVMFFTPLDGTAHHDAGDTADTDTGGEPCFQDDTDTESPYLGMIAAVLAN